MRRCGGARPRPPPHDTRGTSRSAPRDHWPDLDGIGVVDPRVTSDELVADDDEHRFGIQLEMLQQRSDGHRSSHVDLAARVAQQHLHRNQATGLLRAWNLADLDALARSQLDPDDLGLPCRETPENLQTLQSRTEIEPSW